MRRTASAIRRFVRNELLDGLEVAGDPLAQGLLDSLDLEQLLSFLEERFGVRFGEDELAPEHVASIRALAEVVDAKRRQARPAGRSPRVRARLRPDR